MKLNAISDYIDETKCSLKGHALVLSSGQRAFVNIHNKMSCLHDINVTFNGPHVDGCHLCMSQAQGLVSHLLISRQADMMTRYIYDTWWYIGTIIYRYITRHKTFYGPHVDGCQLYMSEATCLATHLLITRQADMMTRYICVFTLINVWQALHTSRISINER